MDNYRVVRCYDPAIDDDTDGMMMGEYARDRDLTKLRFVDPAIGKPIVFTCRHLTVAQRRVVTAALDEHEQHRRAFAYGVVRAEDLPDEQGTLSVFEPRLREGRAMPDSDLERFGEDDVQEIGSVIKARSFLGKGMRLRLLALGSSLAACRTALLLSAERKRDQASST